MRLPARVLAALTLLPACPPATLDPIVSAGETTTAATTTPETDGMSSVTMSPPPTGTTDPTTAGAADTDPADTAALTSGTTGAIDLLTCQVTGTCNQLDLLLIIDNSGSMGEEQQNLAQQFPLLVQRLRTLDDAQGQPVGADVHVMVTTTDVGHPLCAPFNKMGYEPAMGGPIATPCVDRLARFNPIADGVPVPEACTSVCPQGAAPHPGDPFIAFDLGGDNIIDDDGMGDPVADAMACIAPQGIDGCGMEGPLEAMRLALDPAATWNTGPNPFLREGGVLAVVILTDETDCSTEDFNYFDPQNKDPEFTQYWPEFPGTPGEKKDPTSAVCWNASMTCVDADDDTVYESCVSEDKGVLFAQTEYMDFLADSFTDAGKPTFMLLLSGVPAVTAHAEQAPHGPSDGGVLDLVYRKWQPSDILPGDPKSAAQKDYEFGIGPGCSNAATGQAIPPGRLQTVCESLNQPDELRCCIESICDPSFAGAMDCLADMLAQQLTAD